MRRGRTTNALKEWLPTGDTLPTETWEARHRGMLVLLWAHAVALPLLALGYGTTVPHALAEGGIIAVCAIPATLVRRGGRRPRALLVTFGLLTCSATLVHVMGGAIEAHFHYFVIVAVLALYEEWTSYIAAVLYVLFQHAVGTVFAEHSIFTHGGNPWIWSAVHAGFIAALSAASVVNWRAAEALRAETSAANAALAQANAALMQRAVDLERSNRELEEFAYVASHDLAEPLRSIGAYLELIERRTPLDEESKVFFGHARAGARRMGQLIDDLLRYSRTGRTALERRPVPTEQIVGETMRDLAAQIESSGARVEVGELPVVEADPVLLGQVFQNLVANAVKFHADDPPVVRVSGREVPEGWEFTVQDNGIGVPPVHAEKVFKMFGRLHRRDEYEGTGIGLSVCQRIVERHGGQIHVEPGEGGGSRFVFTVARGDTVNA